MQVCEPVAKFKLKAGNFVRAIDFILLASVSFKI